MSKVVYRITEGDLHNMIRKTVNKILKENMPIGGNPNDGVSDVNQQQVERPIEDIANSFKKALTINHNIVHEGDGELEVSNNDDIFNIEYTVSSSQYIDHTISMDYDIPDSYDTNGDWEFVYMRVFYYDENNDEKTLFELKEGNPKLNAMKRFFEFDVNGIPSKEDYFYRNGF